MTWLEKSTPVRRGTLAQDVPHGVKEDLVITLYPRGIIGIREHRRAADSEMKFDAGVLYTQAVIAKALAARHEKRKGRRVSR